MSLFGKSFCKDVSTRAQDRIASSLTDMAPLQPYKNYGRYLWKVFQECGCTKTVSFNQALIISIITIWKKCES